MRRVPQQTTLHLIKFSVSKPEVFDGTSEKCGGFFVLLLIIFYISQTKQNGFYCVSSAWQSSKVGLVLGS